MSENIVATSEGTRGRTRLAIGLLQGLALYLLVRSTDGPVWPATQPMIFAPLFAVALFVPVVLLLDLGVLKVSRLALWALAASVFVGGLAACDIYRGAERPYGLEPSVLGYPSPMVLAAIALSLFIAQCLVIPSEAERKIPASYSRYFDEAWKCAVQLIFSAVFVGLFWGVLTLGTELFELLKIRFFSDLIKHRWFALPITTLALAAAIHLTDIRVAIVRGIRTLKLTLLSWLLPLMTLIAVGFVVALPFTGLDPLWRTRFAVWLLIAASVALIVLVNSAYQDGQAERAPPRLLRYAGSFAVVTLPVLVGLAGYALFLRVEQRGWTSSRIFVAATIGVLVCYALGYVWALVMRGEWLRRLETVNIATAVIVLGLILAFFTPIADPARIAVANQVARLEAGKVPVAQFDFKYLRFDGARYGREALERLKDLQVGENAAAIRQQAETALKLTNRYGPGFAPPTALELAGNITAHPEGRAVPEAFLAQDWKSTYNAPGCLHNRAVQCDAFFLDIDGDGAEEIILIGPNNVSPAVNNAAVFKRGADGLWSMFGSLSGPQISCPDVRTAARAGALKTVPPVILDIEIGTRRLRFNPQQNYAYPLNCP